MEIMKNSKLTRLTALYLFIIAVIGGVSLTTSFTIGDFSMILPYMPEDLAEVSINVILIPMLGGVTVFYIAGLIGMHFEGKLNTVLISGLYAGGFVSIIVIFMIIQPGSGNIRRAGYFVAAGFLAYLCYSVLSSYSKIRNRHKIRIVSGSVTIFILGQLLIQIVNTFMVTPGVPVSDQVRLIREIITWGFVSGALLTLVGTFKESRNPFMSQIGEITSNYFTVMAISLIGTLYINIVRGRVTEVNPVIGQLAPYIEWTGIVILGSIIFTVMRRGMNESMMVPAEIGEWRKHVQEISPTKGEELENFTRIIMEFVEKGNKERIIVRLFNFLDLNRASESEMTEILEDIINHEDEKAPSFSRKGVAESIGKRNQEQRFDVLEKTVNRINAQSLWRGSLETYTDEFNQIQSQERMEN
jgi:hypothetical protein